MLEAVKNIHQTAGIHFDEALRMASLNPAAMMGIEDYLGKIKPGYSASMILIDDNLNLLRSWIDGEEIRI